MRLSRIKAVILLEFLMLKNELSIFWDIVIFPAINILIFGLVAIYLTASGYSDTYFHLLIGAFLWQVFSITQFSVSVASLRYYWSGNLVNIFISPLSAPELLGTHMVVSALKSSIPSLLFASASIFLFKFNIFELGALNLFLFAVNLWIFAWAIALIILGSIYRFGIQYQSLAWGLLYVFQPLTGAFFPVTILPKWVQFFSYLLPPTYVFEAARAALTNPAVNWTLNGKAFGLNVVFLSVGIFIFYRFFNKSRETGQFIKNEN